MSTPTRDASSPGYFNMDNAVTTGVESGTSASFSPPANSLILCYININCANNFVSVLSTPTNTGTALTWHLYAKISPGNATSNMAAAIYWAWNASAQTGITVSCQGTTGNATAVTNDAQSSVDVWTNAKSDQSTAASTSATGSTAVNLTASLTTNGTGSILVGTFGDWSGGELPTTSDIGTGWQSGGNSDGIVVRGTVTGAPGSNSLHASASFPKWTYVLAEILAATIVDEDAEFVQFIQAA